MQTKETLY